MRLHPIRSGYAWVGSRLREEDGIALILALVVVVILAVVLSTVLFYSASGARDAKRTNAGQRAYSIAEAGLNNALAQLASHYPNPDYQSDTTVPPPPDAPWVSGPVTTYSGGKVAWTGTFSSGVWTLTGTGTVKNPTGGADIVRKVSATLPVSIVPAPLGLYGIYSDDPNAPCTDLSGSVTVNVPIFSRNCLKISGGISGSLTPAKDCFKSAADGNYYCPDAKVWDPPPWAGSTTTGTPPVTTGGVSGHTVTINVLHGITLSGGATVGYKAGAVDHSVKSVSYGTPACCFGTAGGVTSLAENNTPRSSGFLTPLDAPTLYSTPDWKTATCTGTNPYDTTPYVRNNSGGNLFSASAYSCTITDAQGAIHSISWNPNSNGCGAITLTGIKCLSISGSWFIDSDVSPGNTTIYYTGKGTLYINGSVTFNNTSICATQDCGSWDPLRDSSQPNMLLVAVNATSSPVATSFQMKNSSVFEGNAWAVGNGNQDASPPPTGAPCSAGAAFSSAGSAYIGGSVWTQNGCASLSGGGVLHSATALPAGAPTAEQYDIVGRITNYKGG